MKNRITLLLTCCLGDYMQGTIRCFKNNPDGRDIKIVGTDMNDMSYNFVGVDKFYKVSRCDSTDYVFQLLEICRKEEVDVLIPCNTNELEKLSDAKDLFADIGTMVLISNIDGLLVSNDKIESYDFFNENGILTPHTLITSSYDELREFLDLYEDKTFVMKQRHGCGSRGFRIIGMSSGLLSDKPSGVFIEDEELKRVFNGESEYLVQEYLAGDEYTVDLVVNNGETVYYACKLNGNMENGVARKSTIVSNPQCESQCIEVCRALKLHGNIAFFSPRVRELFKPFSASLRTRSREEDIFLQRLLLWQSPTSIRFRGTGITTVTECSFSEIPTMRRRSALRSVL